MASGGNACCCADPVPSTEINGARGRRDPAPAFVVDRAPMGPEPVAELSESPQDGGAAGGCRHDLKDMRELASKGGRIVTLAGDDIADGVPRVGKAEGSGGHDTKGSHIDS